MEPSPKGPSGPNEAPGHVIVLVSMHDSRLPHAASRRMDALIHELQRQGRAHIELAPRPPTASGLATNVGSGWVHSPRWIASLLGNHRALPVRTIGEWSYAAWVAIRLARLRPGMVLLTVPPVPLLVLAILDGLRIGRTPRCVLEFRDLTWEYARGADCGRIGRIVAEGYERLARRALRSAAKVVATTQSQADVLAHLSPRASEPLVVRNGVSEELMDLLWPLAARPPDADQITLLYAGTVGYAQDVAQLLRIADLAPSARVRIIGSGPLFDTVAEAARDRPNVQIDSAVPFDELLDEYASADVLLSCLRAGPRFATAVPSKLYEFAATGRVVGFVGPGEAQVVCRQLGGISADEVTPEFVEWLLLEAKERRAVPLFAPPAALTTRSVAAARMAGLLGSAEQAVPCRQ